jgi:hypothetical protein
MSQPEKPSSSRAGNAAIQRAITGWQAPATFAGTQILTHTASFPKSPLLEAAFVDSSNTNTFVKTLRQDESIYQAVLPTILGSSLSARVARPGLLGINMERFTGDYGVAGGLATVGKQIALINESLVLPKQRLAEVVKAAQVKFTGWSPYFEQFGQVMSDFADAQRDLDEETDIFVARHGWPIPTSLTLRAYKQVVAKAHAGKREVSALMVRWFRPGTGAYRVVREVLDESPDFASRRPLMRQVYAAQRRGHWYLVINGLLPLVEGVLIDAMFPTGSRPRTVKPGVKRLVAAPEATFQEPTFRALETMIVGAGSGLALFDDYAPPPGVEPRSLNRNGILHGAARRYGTEQNATKLFLLVGLLAECLGMYRELRNREERQDRV